MDDTFMVNLNDFRYMRCGKQLADLNSTDASLMKPTYQYGSKKKRALMLIHGFASSPAVFRYLIPQLKKYDAIICPTLPGHAQSIKAFAKVTAQDWMSSARSEYGTLFQNYEKVDILGLSLGALLACQLSVEYSPNQLFLLAPAFELQMNMNINIALLHALKRLGFCELRGNAGTIHNPMHAEISYRRTPIAPIIELFTLIREFNWNTPSCPTHLFLGAHDSVVASKNIEKKLLQQPNITIHWLLNSSHLLPLDNDCDEIVACINECI